MSRPRAAVAVSALLLVSLIGCAGAAAPPPQSITASAAPPAATATTSLSAETPAASAVSTMAATLAPATATATAAVTPTAVAHARPTAAPTQGLQVIALTEWSVSVSSTTLKAGRALFVITDAGKAPHELLVFKSDLDPSRYPVDKAGDIIEDGPGVTLLSDGENIDPGGSQGRAVDLVPGKYLFVCNIPGHFKAGMKVAVTVVG